MLKGAEAYIIDCLKWGWTVANEGPGLRRGPYRQSERKEIYRKHAQQLIDTRKKHIMHLIPEVTLNELRASNGEIKNMILIPSAHAEFRLPYQKINAKIISKLTHPMSFSKVPANQDVLIQDLVRGPVDFTRLIWMIKVLIKSDGMPTSHGQCGGRLSDADYTSFEEKNGCLQPRITCFCIRLLDGLIKYQNLHICH